MSNRLLQRPRSRQAMISRDGRTITPDYLTVSDLAGPAGTTGYAFTDSLFSLVGNVSSAKSLVFQVDTQGAGFSTTIDVGAQTGSRTISLPVVSGSDTLAAIGTAQTFSAAQTFTGGATVSTAALTVTDVNLVLSTTTGTKIGTATTQKIAFYNSTPIVQPSGDVATALSNLGLVSGPTIAATSALDGTFRVQNTSDTTKQLAYSLSGMTANRTLTLSSSQSTSQTLNIPNITATDTVATLGLAQTFTAAKTFNTSAPSTSGSTGAIIVPNGGIGCGRSSFFSGSASAGDSTAVGTTFFANQSVDPAAFVFGLDFKISNSGSTAGNSSESIGIQAAVTFATANTYATVAGLACIMQCTAGTYTSIYGLHCRQFSLGGSTTTTAVGLQVDNVSGATNNFAIRTSSGVVSIGDTTDASAIGTAGTVMSCGLSVAKSIYCCGTAGNFINITNSTGALKINSTQVVGPRITGYGTPTNAAVQVSFDATTITHANLAAAVAQLILDLKTHGLLGT